MDGACWWLDYATISYDRAQHERKFSNDFSFSSRLEGTHSELVRGHGLRRTKYRGFNRVALSHYLIGAACNVKRLLRRLAFEMEMGRMTPA